MEQPTLSSAGTPFGVIATTLGNKHYNKHMTTETPDRCCLANEMTVNDPFPGVTDDGED